MKDECVRYYPKDIVLWNISIKQIKWQWSKLNAKVTSMPLFRKNIMLLIQWLTMAKSFVMSTMTPIVKNRNTDITCIGNYCANPLNNILGTLLGCLVLNSQ